MTKVRRLQRGRSWDELSIAVMDDEGIAAVNTAYLGRPGPTDVISFAYPPPAEGLNWCGEVVVNLQRALEEGGRRGDVVKEFALYIAHGCDHLSDADDNTPSRRRRMRRRELRWLEEIEYRDIIALSIDPRKSN